MPTLFISGLADTLVPPRMMVDLHNRCGSIRKQLLELQMGTHNETWTVKGYYHGLAIFLQSTRMQAIEKPCIGKEPTYGWTDVQTI